MGSGKTFEVVSVVILGALRDGRRVISNIAGLNYDYYREIRLRKAVILTGSVESFRFRIQKSSKTFSSDSTKM